RKRQRVLWSVGAYRCLRHQISVERLQVGVGCLGEMRVGKRRIKMSSVAMDALAHGALEGGVGPGADARLEIGRDVGAVDDSERRLERSAARVESTIGLGVTD